MRYREKLGEFEVNLFADVGDRGYLNSAMKNIIERMTSLALAAGKGDGSGIQGAANALADIAVDKVWSAYEKAALAMGDDSPEIDIYSEATETGARVVATGDDVYFLEFGIGKDVSSEGGDFAEQAGVEVTPGSWSREHEGPYSKYGHWHFSKLIRNRVGNRVRRSEDYTGVPGSHGMFKALKHIEEVADKEIKKALNEI